MNLFECGVLCNLRISRWSGQKRLTDDDMKKVGIDPSSLPAEITNLGKKMLISPSELRMITGIESMARSFLAKSSKPFVLANCAFIPKKMFPTVEERLLDMQSIFNEEVDKFILKFDEMKKDVQERYPEFWDKCLKSHYPSDPKDLRSKFSFTFTFFKIDPINDEKRESLQKEVQEFVSEYVGTMRQQTMEFCDLLKARITGDVFGKEKEARKLTTRTLSSFRKYVDTFKNMNIFQDSEIENMLVSFRKEFMGELVTADSFENSNVKKSVLNALKAIKTKIDTESSEGSEFISSLKRKVVI